MVGQNKNKKKQNKMGIGESKKKCLLQNNLDTCNNLVYVFL